MPGTCAFHIINKPEGPIAPRTTMLHTRIHREIKEILLVLKADEENQYRQLSEVDRQHCLGFVIVRIRILEENNRIVERFLNMNHEQDCSSCRLL